VRVATARAQGPRTVIGVLGSGPIPGSETGLTQGLKTTGFVEGENTSIDWRRGEGPYNRLSSQADEPVSRNVALIVAPDVPAALAAKAATKAAAIVFLTGADPVGLGLADSLDQPRGNITGVTTLLNALGPSMNSSPLSGRRLEVPTASAEGELDTAFTTMGRKRGRCAPCKARPVLHLSVRTMSDAGKKFSRAPSRRTCPSNRAPSLSRR